MDKALAVSNGFISGSKTFKASWIYPTPRGSPVATNELAASHCRRARTLGSFVSARLARNAHLRELGRREASKPCQWPLPEQAALRGVPAPPRNRATDR